MARPRGTAVGFGMKQTTVSFLPEHSVVRWSDAPSRLSFVTPSSTYHTQQHYVLRIMLSLVFALLLLIGLVRWWPTGPDAPPDLVYSTAGTDRIDIEEIQPTSQSRERRPPPPAPLPPVVVPNTVLDEVPPLDFTDTALPIAPPGEDAERQEGTRADAGATPRPDVNARLLRYVEPDYPRAARRRNLQAEVVIEVQVTAAGRVETATILERTVLDAAGEPVRTVDELGYGLEEAALQAARRCLFRPARAAGEPVPTRTTLTIRFGR